MCSGCHWLPLVAGRQYKRVVAAKDRAIDAARVVRFGGQRIPIGERKHTRERYERLRDELGEAFIDGTVDREASVRQWDKRRRDRQVLARLAQALDRSKVA